MQISDLEKMSVLQLLEIKEMFRVKHGLYIENNMKERGSANHKTKPYWTCTFKKRVKCPTKKGVNYNNQMSYQTYEDYKVALVFCLSIAEEVNVEMTQYQL